MKQLEKALVDSGYHSAKNTCKMEQKCFLGLGDSSGCVPPDTKPKLKGTKRLRIPHFYCLFYYSYHALLLVCYFYIEGQSLNLLDSYCTQWFIMCLSQI